MKTRKKNSPSSLEKNQDVSLNLKNKIHLDHKLYLPKSDEEIDSTKLISALYVLGGFTEDIRRGGYVTLKNVSEEAERGIVIKDTFASDHLMVCSFLFCQHRQLFFDDGFVQKKFLKLVKI